MQFTREQLGAIFSDGRRRRPSMSAYSGRSLADGDPVITFGPDARYFVGVKTSEWNGLTSAQRQAMKAEFRRFLPTEAPEDEVIPQAKMIETYADVPMKELRKMADARGVITTGLHTAADFRNAMMANDLVGTAVPAGTESAVSTPTASPSAETGA